MLSHLHLELLRLVRARPLVSVAVGCGRYSVGYSALRVGRVRVGLRPITLCLQATARHASLTTMPPLPAICQTCGTIFRSGFWVDDSINVTMSGNLAGPCPQCGQMGRIPDGLFNFIGEAVEVIESPGITTSRLQELIDLVRGLAIDSSMTPEQVADAVAEKAPGLGAVLKKYLVPQSAADFYAMLAALIGLLTLLLAMMTQGQQAAPHTTEIINQVINNCVNNSPLPPIGPTP
jgi:hypothetical protein